MWESVGDQIHTDIEQFSKKKHGLGAINWVMTHINNINDYFYYVNNVYFKFEFFLTILFFRLLDIVLTKYTYDSLIIKLKK